MATHQPTLIAATNVTTAVTTAMVHSGSAQRTDQPSWSTSRLVRVSRSPEPADSTTPTGSASALATKSSRSSASTFSPRTWLASRAYRVRTVCRTRKPASARMTLSTYDVVVPVSTASTRSPSSRGAARAATAARTCRDSAVHSSRGLRRAIAAAYRRTAGVSAIGSEVVVLSRHLRRPAPARG